MIIGYILNAIAFGGMVVYIKSIQYFYHDDVETYRPAGHPFSVKQGLTWGECCHTIKLRIISWCILLMAGLIPYIGILLYPITAVFLVQSKIEDSRFAIIYSNRYRVFSDAAKVLCKPFKCIINFFDKEL